MLTVSLGLALVFPLAWERELDVKEKSSRRGMQEVDLGICGAAGSVLVALGLTGLGLLVSTSSESGCEGPSV